MMFELDSQRVLSTSTTNERKQMKKFALVVLGCILAPFTTVASPIINVWQNGMPYESIDVYRGSDGENDPGFDLYAKKGDSDPSPTGGTHTPEIFLTASTMSGGVSGQIQQVGHIDWAGQPQHVLYSFNAATYVINLQIGEGSSMVSMSLPVRSDLRFNGVLTSAYISSGSFNSPPGTMRLDITSFNGESMDLCNVNSNPKVSGEVGAYIIWWDPYLPQQSFSIEGWATFPTNGSDWNRSFNIDPVMIMGVVPTPEPTATLLLLAGAATVAGTIRRRL